MFIKRGSNDRTSPADRLMDRDGLEKPVDQLIQRPFDEQFNQLFDEKLMNQPFGDKLFNQPFDPRFNRHLDNNMEKGQDYLNKANVIDYSSSVYDVE